MPRKRGGLLPFVAPAGLSGLGVAIFLFLLFTPIPGDVLVIGVPAMLLLFFASWLLTRLGSARRPAGLIPGSRRR